MMKRKKNVYGKVNESSNTTSSSASREEEVEWEMRPGGMLVQKRTDITDTPAQNLRLRIAFGVLRYEISVNSQATFGEVKKQLTAETGLQPSEQRLIFKGKERANGEYLDTCGVKDRSKVILMEDPTSVEKRYIEKRRNAKIQSAHRAISDVSMEIDRLAEQVSSIEKSISKGVKVAEVQITTLTEMLMRQAIKLDNISAEGDAIAQKNLQGKRVQKCVETLDILNISNVKMVRTAHNDVHVVSTTKWESFDPPSTTTSHWELFD